MPANRVYHKWIPCSPAPQGQIEDKPLFHCREKLSWRRKRDLNPFMCFLTHILAIELIIVAPFIRRRWTETRNEGAAANERSPVTTTAAGSQAIRRASLEEEWLCLAHLQPHASSGSTLARLMLKQNEALMLLGLTSSAELSWFHSAIMVRMPNTNRVSFPPWNTAVTLGFHPIYTTTLLMVRMEAFLKVKDFNSSLGATLPSSFWRFHYKSGTHVCSRVDFWHRSRNCDLHGKGVSKYWGKMSARTVWKLFCFLFLLSPFSLYR